MAEYYDPETYPKKWNYLQSGTIIDQYMIERELAHGGFSSVYLARQVDDQVQVAIKEYLPRKFAHRTWNNVVTPHSEETKILFLRGRALFFEEAKVLANLKHHNIVNVINFFQANETVYMVMVYDYGMSLDNVVRDSKIQLDEQLIIAIFNRLLTGINIIHQQKMLHLDIKPSNILIRPDFDPLLLDFGAIRSFPKSSKNRQTKVLTKGFSPAEQYSITNTLGPWTDLYAVGATMRYCLGGKTLIPSPDRANKDTMVPAVKAYKRKFPEYLLKAIDWAMEIEAKNRPQSVEELQSALLNN